MVPSPALSSALALLGEEGPLAEVAKPFEVLGVYDTRVLADLFGSEDPKIFIKEILGKDALELTADEDMKIANFKKKVLSGAQVEKRMRDSESYCHDLLKVTKERRIQEAETPDKRANPSPLPGLLVGLKRFRGRTSGTAGGLAEEDKKEKKNKWTERFAAALRKADAPVVRGQADMELIITAEMAVGRARPGTVRLRLRSWEAFSRWLALSRGRRWPSRPKDLVDYVREMVAVPAPASFPISFSCAARWCCSRTGHDNAEELCDDGLVRRAVHWAEVELGDVAKRTKAPRFPVVVMLSMELTVLDSAAPKVHRVMAWSRLIKIYGGGTTLSGYGHQTLSFGLRD